MTMRNLNMAFLLLLIFAFVPTPAEADDFSIQASLLELGLEDAVRTERPLPIRLWLLDVRGHFMEDESQRVYVYATTEQHGKEFRTDALAHANSDHVLSFDVRHGYHEGEVSFLRSGRYKLYASTEYPGARGKPVHLTTDYAGGDGVQVDPLRRAVDRIRLDYPGSEEHYLEDGEMAAKELLVTPGAAGSEITASLYDADGRPLDAGLVVTAETNNPLLTVSPQKAETNARGEVSFKVTGRLAGDYKLYLDVGSRANGLPVTVKTQSLTMQIGSTRMIVDGKALAMDVAPMIHKNRTYLPYRALGEAFGARVEWLEPLQQVQVFQGSDMLTMRKDSRLYDINGKPAMMDAAPFIHQNRMMVPVRFVGEALAYDVGVVYHPNGTTNLVTFSR